MKFKTKTIFSFIAMLVFTGFITSTFAQTVSIPDPGLNAAVRDALQKPGGPLTVADLLTLTNLNASARNVSSIDGLEAASNLIVLNLQRNHLTSFSLPAAFTNLTDLDLSFNLLTGCTFPTGPTKLTTLNLSDNQLTNLAFPLGLNGLMSLNLEDNGFTSFNLSSNLTRLTFLDVGFNSLTNVSLPNGLTNLTMLVVAGNLLTNFTVPTGLTGLTTLDLHINSLSGFVLPAGLSTLTNLDLDENELADFALPSGMTNLTLLDFSFNQLTNVTLPADLKGLIDLNLNFNELTSLNLPTGLTRLARLHLRANQFINFSLSADLPALSFLDISECPLTNLTLPAGLNQLTTLRLNKNNLVSLTLPVGMTNLAAVNLSDNLLVNLALPSDLIHLTSLNLGGNEFTSLTLPSGLTSLTQLVLTGNQLTNLTLPPDLTQLTELDLAANPLTLLVLSQPLAGNLGTNLAVITAALASQGQIVLTSIYPVTIQLTRVQQLVGAFRFAISGPPGVYTVLSSTNLPEWRVQGSVSNPLGGIFFIDETAQFSPQKFYRAQLQTVPTNLVFVPANTFTLGSPTNEPGHQLDESPQTTVTLSRGFWISKFLVTQRDYLAVIGDNPSGFPGNLDRPVESVSWFAASNYCAQLTQLDLAAGRIPPGTHYRLPTEAEWECAARAGSTTRFYYGDDPGLNSLTNHAWYGANSGFTTRPVGEKQPNAWGLYDMEGNVWEWCQDWYGPYVGGSVTDPQGPASNPIGFKVIRGGAWESSEFDCRSARRSTEGASRFISDFIIGFRVVLVSNQ